MPRSPTIVYIMIFLFWQLEVGDTMLLDKQQQHARTIVALK